LNEILHEQPEIKDEVEARDLRCKAKSNPQADFAYNGKPVLHDLSLRIPAGSSMAIVGSDWVGQDYFGQPDSAAFTMPTGDVQ